MVLWWGKSAQKGAKARIFARFGGGFGGWGGEERAEGKAQKGRRGSRPLGGLGLVFWFPFAGAALLLAPSAAAWPVVRRSGFGKSVVGGWAGPRSCGCI